MKYCLETVFYIVDNLVKAIRINTISDPILQEIFILKNKNLGRKSKLSLSEAITLAVIQHYHGIKTLKQLYEFINLNKDLRNAFNDLPSYEQFNRTINAASPYIYLITNILIKINKNKKSEYHIIDSTPLPICHFKNYKERRIGKGKATISKNIYGWFYGYKLHLIVNKYKDITSFKFTTANVSDRKAIDDKFVKDISILVGDKGYLGKEFMEDLFKKNVYLITRQRINMKSYYIKEELDLLGKRKNIETVFSVLKSNLSLVNRFARSLNGFFRQAISALLAYSLKRVFSNQLIYQFLYRSISRKKRSNPAI